MQISLKYNLQEESIILNKGESIDIPPLLPHRFEALVDSKILEASNEDREEEDLVRVEPGDTQEAPRLPIGNRKFIEWEGKMQQNEWNLMRLIIIALAISQVITFVRLKESEDAIGILLETQDSLFECIRIQNKINSLQQEKLIPQDQFDKYLEI